MLKTITGISNPISCKNNLNDNHGKKYNGWCQINDWTGVQEITCTGTRKGFMHNPSGRKSRQEL